MKKFFALLIATLLLVAVPAQAQTQTIPDTETLMPNERVEKFYNSLPQAKGDYKSRVRPIMIQGAMNTETVVLIRALKNPVAYREQNYLFVTGTYKDYPVVIVRTEIGAANAAASTALAIKKFNPVAVINQGTAGGYLPALHVGDIVIGEKTFDRTAFKCAYSVAGAGIDLTKQENIGTYAYNAATKDFQAYTEFFPDPTLLKVAKKVADVNKNFSVVSGVISTGNSWLECIDYINFLHEKYGSSCEEMETNIVAQICQNTGIPFIGIRVISNNITNNSRYVPESAKIGQNFVLLVAENYIRDILKR